MGKIRSTGLTVECDRCKKDIPVLDDDQAAWYRDFDKREDQNVHMFQALQLKSDGKDADAVFELLCPKCENAVATYMDKILMIKDESKGKKNGEKTQEKKTEKKAEKKEAEKKAAPAEDPTVDAPPPEDDEPGLSFDEEEMFAKEG